ncbi:MAG: tyrosine--tRNA ligase [Oscillospiraceae bacterium]|nr:tyrosine--tRNA ligase [Oscillospiraceae bacterium]
MMHILDTLKDRGFIAQMTFEEDLYKQLERESTTLYVGLDPTADSLHIGHMIPVYAMAHFQRAGHRPIILMGGGTAMIGDPSGKTALRAMLTRETIDHNIRSIQAQLSRLVDFAEGRAILADNGDWLRGLNYIDFMREIGAFFSVNRMLTAECYKARLEKGLSFLEFTYMLLQSYDFLELFRRYGCRVQVGGDDQWSNMLGGADLIRRKESQDAYVTTFKLLLTSDGRKMGKTEAGALWLDAARVSPYDFYQYWRNLDDADVQKCLALLTFLSMDEVRRLGALRDADINEAKRVLAYEVTKIAHGEQAAADAQQAAAALFGDGGDRGGAPRVDITAGQLAQDARLTTLLVTAGLAASRGEARKLVQGGGVYLGESPVTDIDHTVSAADFGTDGLLLRKGKKHYCRVTLRA